MAPFPKWSEEEVTLVWPSTPFSMKYTPVRPDAKFWFGFLGSDGDEARMKLVACGEIGIDRGLALVHRPGQVWLPRPFANQVLPGKRTRNHELRLAAGHPGRRDEPQVLHVGELA